MLRESRDYVAQSRLENGGGEAVDQQMFNASNGELLAAFCKVEPFLTQMREQNADTLRHLEEVARQFPNAETRLPGMREQFRAMAAARTTQTT